jgi:hypothetical protein
MAERCGHCGREGTVARKEDVVLSRKIETAYSGNETREIDVARIASIGVCSGCDQLTLETYIWVDEFMESPDDTTVTVVYPKEREIADLPDRVRERYSAMLELQHAPDAFAVRAGRLLEAVCLERGIPRSEKRPDLSHRIDGLIKAAKVPKALTDQAHLVRRYRNLGGHDNGWDVEEEDVPLIRRFVETLLDFLYWGPANLARVNAEFERREVEAEAARAD